MQAPARHLRWLLGIAIALCGYWPAGGWAVCTEAAKPRATAAPKEASPRFPVPARDGSQPDSALYVDATSLLAIRLSVTAGTACHVMFRVPLSTRVELSIDGGSVAEVPALRLTTTDREPKRTIEGRPSADGRRVEFDLYPAGYHLEVPKAPAVIASQGTGRKQFTVVATFSQRLGPRWSLAPGARAPLRLDPVARVAEREIVVERRSMIAFSLTGVPPLPKFHPWVRIDLFGSDGKEVWASEHSEYDAAVPRAAFIVPPGIYLVVPHARYNGWPSPELAEPLRSQQLTLQADAITPADLAPAMQRLNDWIGQVGLGDLVEVSEVLDLRESASNLPGALSRLGGFAVEVARYRAKDPNWNFASIAPPDGDNRLDWPAGAEPRDRPVLVILFSLKVQNRWAFGATERALRDAHGTSMWSRLLQRVSTLEGLPARSIAMVAPVPCDPHLVFLTSAGEAGRHGTTCLSASSSAALFSAASLARAADSSLGGAIPSLGTTMPPLLRSYFSNSTSLEFLTTDDDFVEVIVRGLRGLVVRGGADWEKLQLTLALTGAKTAPTLRVTVDGDLASGLGDYPPDSNFIRSMEPQYKGPLSDFTKKLAGDLARLMTPASAKEKP